jgi:hypothetical protein
MILIEKYVEQTFTGDLVRQIDCRLESGNIVVSQDCEIERGLLAVSRPN